MMVLVEKFIGRDLNNKKVNHHRLTPIYQDGTGTFRLGVRFMPPAADPVVERKLKELWRDMIERSDD